MNNQKFMNAINQNIEIVKGDTCIFDFELKGLGSDVSPSFELICREKPEGTKYFDCKSSDNEITQESYDSTNDIYTYSVYIAPSQTTELNVGRYYYDLKMTLDSNVYTLLRGRFELVYDVID